MPLHHAHHCGSTVAVSIMSNEHYLVGALVALRPIVKPRFTCQATTRAADTRVRSVGGRVRLEHCRLPAKVRNQYDGVV